MVQKFISIAIFSLVLVFFGNSTNVSNVGSLNKMNALQLIKKYGYPAEAHTVKTADGYLLEVHRIAHGIKAKPPSRRPPVLIAHGVLCSSDSFLILGPSNSLAFLLADLGFDVWLGNVRGNVYSRQHVTLDPSEKSFWNYSWHESGVYDLPALIDFILGETSHEKLIFIGHSMGSTMFLVLLSTKSEYNDKIETALLMAPITHLKNSKSPMLKALAPFFSDFEVLSEIFGHGEIFASSTMIRQLGNGICGITFKTCLNIMYGFAGGDPKDYKKEVLDAFLSHFPAGYSFKGLKHFYQIMISGLFREYDYGEKNDLIYGNPSPPEYDLQNIKVPLTIYIAKKDYLCAVSDMERLAQNLSSLKNVYVVDSCDFSHLDFIIGEKVKTDLYNTMLANIFSHLRERLLAQRRLMKSKAANGGQTTQRTTETDT